MITKHNAVIGRARLVATNSYPGDTFNRVDVLLTYPDGRKRWQTAFGVWRRRNRFGTWYESDGNGVTYDTAAQVKRCAQSRFA